MSAEQEMADSDEASEPVEIAPGIFSMVNEGGGTSILVGRSANLANIPKSHKKLLTPSLTAIFPEAEKHFGQVAAACPLPKMKRWLNRLVKNDTWFLMLHKGEPKGYTQAGFGFLHDKIIGAEIAPAFRKPPRKLPDAMRALYGMVGSIDWVGFGVAGGIGDSRGQKSLTQFGYDTPQDTVDPAATFAFGESPSGDQIIYTLDGRGGWWCHENGQIHILGSIEKTIDWVFGELLSDRIPRVDYEWFP